MRDLRELNKLERYLRANGYNYERIDKEGIFDRHQIIVYDRRTGEEYLWDAICHFGSYGCDMGLLEIMGTIVENEYDEVEGNLTALDIINRLEKKG